MHISCPKCGKAGCVDAPGIGVANDNLVTIEAALAIDVPEGFRVVVVGWDSPYEHLCCMKCGLPAKRSR